MSAPSIEAGLIREHLELLRASATFARSTSLFLLLEYVVRETLEGRGATLKELVIGDALYGRSAPYDPRIDSTVRVEARRLRRKLADHYTSGGCSTGVRIELPTGSYRPVFSLAEGASGESVRSTAGESADIAIMPFRALSCGADDDTFANGLTDELIYALEHRSGLRVAPRLMVFQFQNRQYSVSEATNALGVGAMLHGTFRTAGDRTRVTVELTDPHGFVTWSTKVDECSDEPLVLQERLAEQIVSRMPASVIGRQSKPRPLMKLVG